MDTKAPNLIPSGIEPVDKLMGGLESGQSYLVHGEASGKSLFGIKFLIEGLKRGENGALVIRYSPEDAVRRFARLGYDCLEDVYSGRLVILEYSDDIIQQISRLRELTPVLRELEWLLGETRPQRIIFDPFTSLVDGEGDIHSRVREFTDWARSFGATVVYIANGGGKVVEAIKAHTAEVFRFEVKEITDRAMRFISFEKTPAIPDQAIEVDPSRGIFLLERAKGQEQFFSMFQATPSNAESRVADKESPATSAPAATQSTGEESAPPEQASPASPGLDKLTEPVADKQFFDKASAGMPAEKELEGFDLVAANGLLESEQDSSQTSAPTTEIYQRATIPLTEGKEARIHQAPAQPHNHRATINESTSDVFSDLADELTNSIAPLDLDLPELEPVGLQAEKQTPSASDQADQAAQPATGPQSLAGHRGAGESLDAQPRAASLDAARPERKHSRASDLKIDSMIAARAAEILLRPPDTKTEQPASAKVERRAAHADTPAPVGIQPKDFNVLIIQDDPVTREVIAHTLSDYTIGIVEDGVSGLAKLISQTPDLVVLDLDLPIIDGFKVLEHIRASLNMPIIIVSGSRVRAIDRVRAAELGADYYLTKPFSVIELKHKARQLIARYRGINSWILSSNAASSARAQHDNPQHDNSSSGESASVPIAEPLIVSIGPEGEQFIPYQEFASQVEERVKTARDTNAAFSVVGCRLAQMTSNGGQSALRLYDLVRTLVRETDLISTNTRNDLVILLTDANADGAQAFISRLRERVLNELNQEPSVWLRSFPDLEEANEATSPASNGNNGSHGRRRASDKQDENDSAPIEPRAERARR